MVRYDFSAVNARGITVHTFGDFDSAKRWVRDNAPIHDGLHVQCVTTTVRTEVLYRPRAHLRAVAA